MGAVVSSRIAGAVVSARDIWSCCQFYIGIVGAVVSLIGIVGADVSSRDSGRYCQC